MQINNFNSFEVGTVFNPLPHEIKVEEPVMESVRLDYPSRLGAMTLDPSKIADNNNMVFPAGQIGFSIGVYKEVEASINESGDITVSDNTPRASIVKHAGRIMQKAIGFDEGIHLSVTTSHDLRHTGLGSSGSTLAGAASAVNELYGNPLSPLELARYCAHNYGEEVDDDTSRLVPVQSIGGSALCGQLEGGLIILSGAAVPIYQKRLADDLKVVIGVPEDYNPLDAEELIRAEVDNMQGFQTSGDTYAPEIAYRLVHQVLPGLVFDDLKPCKDLIFDFRWNMGSIRNCSFVYPRMVDIAESFRDLRDDPRAEIIAPSSVGPAFFSITRDIDYMINRFNDQGLDTLIVDIHNDRYTVKDTHEAK